MKRNFLLLTMLIIVLSSCETVRNLNDYNQKTYELLETNQEEILGTVSVTRFGFIWESFEPNDGNTLRMLAKLEKNAKDKYGENIKLVDIKIGDINPACSVPLWVGGGLAGLGLMALSPSFYESHSNSNTSKTELDGFSYAGGFTIIGTSLLKFNKATAKVIRSTEPYTKDSLLLIKQSELAMKKELKNFTEREREAIMQKKIYIGMSEAALLKSWGKPQDINTSVGNWGVHKQYCYENYKYVYVENGYVTSWQN